MRGAFTGATATRPGLFETADRGTLFLDEIGDLPLLSQVKLLRVLQEGEVKRVGSNETRRVDVRVIAATNVDLRERIAAGKFRQDLYYRLKVVAISLPPLRERRQDIPLLAYHFLQMFSHRTERNVRKLSAEAMRALQTQRWPGNVRELQNAIEHGVVFCKGDSITPADLPFERSEPEAQEAAVAGQADPFGALLDLPYREAKQRALDTFESTYFGAAMDRAGGNISEAARLAGLDRSNFRRSARRAGVVVRDE
jgi:DNA-binding NtrC family response regulator